MLKNKNIFVTGAAGFIGSHLINELIKNHRPNKIIAVDHLKYGSIKNLNHDKRLIFFNKDIRGLSKNFLKTHLKEIDYIFHLAAEKHNQSLNFPEKIFDTNFNATFKLFEIASQCQVKKIIFTSSLYVYKKSKTSAMKENDPIKGDTLYGLSKITGEKILELLHKRYGIKYNIARLFFTYGKNQYNGMGYKSVIIKNFENIINGKNPIIFGDGSQILDYVYVGDVINGLLKLALTEKNGLVVNLGSGEKKTIKELTSLMLKVSNSNLNITYCPPDNTFNTIRFADISLAKKEINWRPMINLSEGLKILYRWLKENRYEK